jgi:hypothetical protein
MFDLNFTLGGKAMSCRKNFFFNALSYAAQQVVGKNAFFLTEAVRVTLYQKISHR